MFVVLLAAVWMSPSLVAAEAEDTPIHREKLEYDPATGQWVAEEPPVPGTPEGDLRLARAALVDGRKSAAYKGIQRWIKTYGETHELYPQAALLRAEIEIARRDYYKAHKHLQVFLNEHAGTEYAQRAVEMEFNIAEVFLSGTKRKFLGMRILPADDVGIQILDDLASNYPETNLAELAVKTKADYYYRTGDFALAELEYAALLKDFPRSRYAQFSMRRGADSALASFTGVEFDDAPLIEAEERYRDYLNAYPRDAEQQRIGLILDEIQERRAEKEYTIGRYYERTGHSRAAVFYYRSTVQHWPDTIHAARANQRLASIRPEVEPIEGSPAPATEEPAAPALREEAS